VLPFSADVTLEAVFWFLGIASKVVTKLYLLSKRAQLVNMHTRYRGALERKEVRHC
jgi:hypothetical protein